MNQRMRIPGPACIGLTFVLLGVGCDAAPPDAPQLPPDEVVSADELDERPVDLTEPEGHHREPILLKLALRGPEGDAVRTLTADDLVEIDIANNSHGAGVVELQVRDTLGASRTGRSVTEVELAAGARTTVAITVGDLGLIDEKTAELGRLSFHARLHTSEGPGTTSAPISIPFSAGGSRWTLYGPDAGEAELAALEIPDDARAELRAVLAEGSQTITLPDGAELRAAAPTLTPVLESSDGNWAAK